MTKLLLILVLWTGFANAADYRLDDPAILGEYTLAKVGSHSEVQTAQIKYNADSELIVDFRDDGGDGFALTGPDKNGVIVDYEDEPNCDGGESACYYDLRTLITLDSAVNKRGEKIPRLTIAITSVNAFDEEDEGETKTYVLNWAREKKDSIPYYTNAGLPKKLNAILKACNKTVKPTVGHGIGSAFDICLHPRSVKLREPLDEAVSDYLAKEANKNAEAISVAKLRSLVFESAEKVIENYGKDGKLKVPLATLLKEFRKIEKYIETNQTEIYFYKFANIAVLKVVDTHTQTITGFQIDIK